MLEKTNRTVFTFIDPSDPFYSGAHARQVGLLHTFTKPQAEFHNVIVGTFVPI